jgi:hypothetical protein
MHLKSSAVWDVLERHGVENLYHANSVVTSCQFIRAKALLARGVLERLELPQTAQYTDSIDKRYSLWFDVFADTVDIHARASRANRYGPVLFVLDLARLRTRYTGNVWVTKLNPTRWPGTKKEDSWFQSNAELEESFNYGDFNQMIVFRHSGGNIPINNAVDKIVLDSPKRRIDGIDVYSAAVGALRMALCESGLELEIERRECPRNCTCRHDYDHHARQAHLFDPYL